MKQSQLEGFERPVVQAVHDVVAEYVEAVEERKRCQEKEAELREHTVMVMRENAELLERNGMGELVYTYHNGDRSFRMEVQISEKAKCYFERKKSENDRD